MHPTDPFCSVDVFVDNPIAFEELWDRSHEETIGGTRCRFASIQDLITMKRIAGRPQDQRDIEALESVQKLREGKA